MVAQIKKETVRSSGRVTTQVPLPDTAGGPVPVLLQRMPERLVAS
jgi:hypothetical protein